MAARSSSRSREACVKRPSTTCVAHTAKMRFKISIIVPVMVMLGSVRAEAKMLL